MTAGANGWANDDVPGPAAFDPVDHVFAQLDMRDVDPPEGADR